MVQWILLVRRRDRDRAEREASDKDRRVQQLEQELQAERARNDRLSVRGRMREHGRCAEVQKVRHCVGTVRATFRNLLFKATRC